MVSNPLFENNYVIVRGFISPSEADSLAQEMYLAEKQGVDGDTQVPNSPKFYNFFPLVKLLVKKIPNVSQICGEEVLPTYVYSRIYKHGAVLARHRDRHACEVSLTLNLQKDTDWPIWIKKPNGEEVSVELNQGDAMLYLGMVAEHWRDAFTGHNMVQAFLHYVRANGPCAYTFFDKTK